MSFRVECANCEWTRDVEDVEAIFRWGRLHASAEDHRTRAALPKPDDVGGDHGA